MTNGEKTAKEFKEVVELFKSGINIGTPFALKRLSNALGGIREGYYYLIAGRPKEGKTALTDFIFVISVYLYVTRSKSDVSYKWYYFSWEISKREKIAKWVSMFIWFFEKKWIEPDDILSVRGTLTDEQQELVNKVVDTHIKTLFDNIVFIESKWEAKQIYEFLKRELEQNGSFQFDENGNRTSFIKSNNVRTIAIFDHVGLIRKGLKQTDKQAIDSLSSFLVELRNNYFLTPVVVTQFKKDFNSMEKLKLSGEELEPNPEDIKETGNLIQDCNLALSIFNPNELKHINSHKGYNLSVVGEGYRSIRVMGGRNVPIGLSIQLNMLGFCGFFKEIPKLDDYEKDSSWKY